MERVDLAHEEAFRLGRLTVRPGLRQLVRDDGADEVVEPRVMQVLVALARTPGAILSRDDLTSSCWEGRVVGDDAINRVVSRLRRAADGIGEGGFRIETVTKVGYRLVLDGAAEAPARPEAGAVAELRRLKLDRRAMLIGAGAAATGAAGWWGWRRFAAPPAETPPPPEVAALMQQAAIAAQQGTAEGGSQALGLLRRVVALKPDYADGWGMLALAYAGAALGGAPSIEADMRSRAQAAIRRAESLDPDNAYASVATDALRPQVRHWASGERTLRTALERHPTNIFLLTSLSITLLSVGRCRECADVLARAIAVSPPTPGLVYSNVQALWAAGRPEEADRAMEAAYQLYPSHFAVWFTRYYILMFSGRAQESLAMSANVDRRPPGIPEFNFPMIDAVAKAMLSHAPADIDLAMKLNLEAAHRGKGFAENTIQFAAALGRIDTAFMVADAYFFNRGFQIGEFRFAPEQRTYQRRDLHRTQFLFYPSTQAMRADPRFEKLVADVGLAQYWKETGSKPDYKS
ncbi:winged helix-turn-helix domain-containing protein [Sphingomonas caeni]|uniref:winged helix-turn-helix domain-containing protein n=1 Tax=Sphingomonas caeni TaxID=2984949 RepID=UPI00222F6147|nr:winged helix-turn-helix domain-containing protein [Sphingomonas caeni]